MGGVSIICKMCDNKIHAKIQYSPFKTPRHHPPSILFRAHKIKRRGQDTIRYISRNTHMMAHGRPPPTEQPPPSTDFLTGHQGGSVGHPTVLPRTREGVAQTVATTTSAGLWRRSRWWVAFYCVHGRCLSSSSLSCVRRTSIDILGDLWVLSNIFFNRMESQK